jgi:hypothetical protein
MVMLNRILFTREKEKNDLLKDRKNAKATLFWLFSLGFGI